MRFNSLDLMAFGHFENCHIDLSGGKYGLHVVYGPNEAGKSTALRAVTTWIYGFKNQTQDNFRFENPQLRIGAEIVDNLGNVIRCVRRKSRHQSLRDQHDQDPVDPLCLERLLRGVSRESFLDRFGITHQALVEGGQMMLRGDGDLGQSLFAAGAGIGWLRRALEGVDEDCGELFKRTGTKSQINQLLTSLREKRTLLKSNVLPASGYLDLQRSIAETQTQAEAFRNATSEARVELSRLQAIQEARPLLSELAGIEQALQSLENTPVLNGDFYVRQQTAATSWHATQETIKLLTQRIESSEKQVASLGAESPVLGQASIIESLHQSLGAITKAGLERPGLVKRLELTESQIADRLHHMGPEKPSAEEPQSISEELMIEIGQLASQWESLQQQIATNHEETGALEAEQVTLNKLLDEQREPSSPDELFQVLQNVGNPTEAVQELHAIDAVLQREDRTIDGQLRTLGQSEADPDEVVRWSVPSPESVEHFDLRWTKSETRIAEFQSKQQQCQEQIASIALRLDEIQSSHQVPTEQELDQTRDNRDRLGRSLCQSQDLSLADVRSQLRDYCDAVRDCDQIADRLRHEASQVAARSQLQSEHDGALLTASRITEQHAEATAEHEQLQSQWDSLWEATPLRPLSPPEMRGWLNRHRQLVQFVEKRDEVRDTLARQKQRMDQSGQRLRRAMERCGSQIAADLDYVEVVQACVITADRLRKEVADFEKHTQRRQQLTEALSAARARADRCQGQFDQWKQRWAAITDRLGLKSDATPQQVNGIVASYQDVRALSGQRDGLRSRIAGIDADADAFREQVSSVELPVPEGCDPSQAVESWAQQLKEAREIASQCEQIHKQWSADKQELRSARQEAVTIKASLDQLCNEAGVDDSELLATVFQNSEHKKKLMDRRDDLLAQISRLASELPRDEFIRQANEVTEQHLISQISVIKSRVAEMESDYELSCRQLGELTQQHKQMDGSPAAANVQQEIQDLLGAIEEQSLQYARLRAASTLLRQTIIRYREQNQGPVVEIASEYFRRLTLDSYDHLEIDNNDKGDPILLAIRQQDGRPIQLSAMSSGTADQLFLALRLASIQHELKSHDPIPLIVDDILIQCDQQRIAAALGVLAELSEKTQVIFFTHNEAILEIAKKTVPRRKLFVQELSAQTIEPPVPQASELENEESSERMLF